MPQAAPLKATAAGAAAGGGAPAQAGLHQAHFVLLPPSAQALHRPPLAQAPFPACTGQHAQECGSSMSMSSSSRLRLLCAWVWWEHQGAGGAGEAESEEEKGGGGEGRDAAGHGKRRGAVLAGIIERLTHLGKCCLLPHALVSNRHARCSQCPQVGCCCTHPPLCPGASTAGPDEHTAVYWAALEAVMSALIQAQSAMDALQQRLYQARAEAAAQLPAQLMQQGGQHAREGVIHGVHRGTGGDGEG
eukprot:scaffold11656_cov18-Tisochrysis_lutea.AAC.1